MRQQCEEMTEGGNGLTLSLTSRMRTGIRQGTLLRTKALLLAGTAAICTLYATPLAAQDASPLDETATANNGTTTSYDAAYFNQFAPQNAFEMIARLPGFNFDNGGDARGFGGNAGNVLVDGARPGSKTGLDNVLRRIPAAQVQRIEVIRGGAGASDAAGQTVIANVVRIPGASTGTSIVRLVRKNDGTIRPQTETSYSTTIDGWETSSKLDAAFRRQPRDISFRDFDETNSLTSSGEEERPENFKWLWYNGEASKDLFGGKLVLNTVAGLDTFDALSSRDLFEGRLPGGTPDGLIQIDVDRDYHEYSLGADWTKTGTDNWKIRLLSFTQYSTRDFTSQFTEEDPVGNQVFLSDFSQTRDQLESIFRTTYGKVGGAKLKPEFGAEVAYNQLKSSFNLAQQDADGVVELDVPSANMKVSEIRGEAFTNLVWAASDKLTIDGGITWEISRISVSGDAANSQTFKFLKPSVAATYNVSDQLQLQLRAQRTVGQLNFEDFAASNDITDDRVLAGNPELSPDQTWRVEGTVDWRFNSRGSINITLFHEWRNDVLEQIILPSGGSGRGNAGSATLYGLEADLILPLDFAIPGGRLEAGYRRRESNLFDPIIGRDRPLSFITPEFVSFEFRQDLVKERLAWGVEMDGGFNDPIFFVSEFVEVNGPYRFNVYAESTRWFGVKMRLEWNRFTGNTFDRDRSFFTTDRGGDFSGRELQRRNFGDTVRFIVTTPF